METSVFLSASILCLELTKPAVRFVSTALYPVVKTNKTGSMTYSPQAEYTDWATTTYRRILVLTFADRGVSRGQRGGTTTAVNLSFLNRTRYFSFQVAPRLSSRV
jgi:hypothetical protein